MLILGIDTSCDDASVAVARDDCLLSNVSSSQIAYHSFWGGVVPSIAKRLHRETIDGVIALALKRAGVSMEEIEVIAVTVGPGLAVALEVGVEKAKELAVKYGQKVVAVNHMEGHIYASFCRNRNGSYFSAFEKLVGRENSTLKGTGKFETLSDKQIQNNTQIIDNNSTIQQFNNFSLFPLIALLISGGHTELVLMRKHLQYEILGRTKDDAVGEAYDKVARMLNLGYPGGPIIEQLAKQGDAKRLVLPVSMLDGGLDFSYSGLKTAVLRQVQLMGTLGPSMQEQFGDKPMPETRYDGYMPKLSNKPTYNLDKQQICDVAASFQVAAAAQLSYKIRKALERYPEMQSVVLGGGVVNNAFVRQALRKTVQKFGVELVYPTSNKLTMDNAGMIAVAGYYNALVGNFAEVGELDRRPGWEL